LQRVKSLAELALARFELPRGFNKALRLAQLVVALCSLSRALGIALRLVGLTLTVAWPSRARTTRGAAATVGAVAGGGWARLLERRQGIGPIASG